CYGWNLAAEPAVVLSKIDNQMQLDYLLEAYRLFPDKASFFLGKPNAEPTAYFFNKLAGNSQLMQQIKEGKTEEEIRASWQPGLENFKKIRARYLIYP
ncbi:MAG: DUF1343 domain-containing protein, partial [Flavihumibacter sp.]|nr:DUF1343 domain-containing protein [Flavihumibacter sp.]